MVDAGHEVTGIHLALSRNPKTYRAGARGCCTIEDANDARRAADVIGIPFYVWDLSDRFHDDVVEDFRSEYLAGRTPNPCLRCNEKIKFAAVLDRALAPGVRRGGDRPLRPAARPGRTGCVEMHRAEDIGKDQSYVLGVLTQEQLRALALPARGHAQGAGAGRGRGPRAARRRQAGQPRHLLHLRRRHRGVAAGEARHARPGRSSTTTAARCWAPTTGSFAFTIGQRRGLRIGHARAPTAGRATSSTSSRSPARSPSGRARR